VKTPPTVAAEPGDEIASLVHQLLESERRLLELTGGEVDAVLDPGGRSYLLRQAQEKLRESEERFRSLFNAAATGIATFTPQGRFLHANEAYCRMLGYTEDELRARDFAPLTHPEDLALELKLRDELLAGQRQSFVLEMRHLKKNGSIVWSRISVSSAQTASGEAAMLVVVAEDFTDRKQMEGRFRRLVDSNAQGVMFWNTKGRITDGNNAFLKLTGHTSEDLEAGVINWVAMTPPEYADLDQRALKELAATGICTPYEKEWIRKDGSRVPILLGAAMFEDNLEEGVCFVLDLTGRKAMEAQFRQSQKMESFGQLAGGVAHDFNNILAVIRLQVDLLMYDRGLTPDQANSIKEIGASAERAAALTRQLLLFSRKEILQLRDLDLNQSITGMTNMLRRVLGADIEVQFRFSLQPVGIHADAGMLDQVLLNLAVNSRDAMPKGGRLIIETSAADFDDAISSQFSRARAGAFVCLAVSDTGCGIPAENLSRIFEPFFTTKEAGKGTGLGLATVFGIVQQHQGWVNVYSEVGHGTTFRIYLPRLLKPSLSPPKMEPVQLAALRGGDATILLVEDDDFVRPATCNTLSRLGYRVFAVRDGIKALEVWQRHRDQIQLLVTDLIMPGGISGRDLGERLSRENPRLKVIYASGYSAEIAGKDFRLEEGVNFLTKPFESQKLARTIRDILDKGVTA